jgi:hypothetical protein
MPTRSITVAGFAKLALYGLSPAPLQEPVAVDHYSDAADVRDGRET